MINFIAFHVISFADTIKDQLTLTISKILFTHTTLFLKLKCEIPFKNILITYNNVFIKKEIYFDKKNCFELSKICKISANTSD